MAEKQLKLDVYYYLDNLKDSGVTNMMGATPYIQEEFNLDKETSKNLLINWIKQLQ
tara:strand:+ start:74 stop:241 length:168 start_codon:yes stop_codon:yes gene_type:complete